PSTVNPSLSLSTSTASRYGFSPTIAPMSLAPMNVRRSALSSSLSLGMVPLVAYGAAWQPDALVRASVGVSGVAQDARSLGDEHGELAARPDGLVRLVRTRVLHPERLLRLVGGRDGDAHFVTARATSAVAISAVAATRHACACVRFASASGSILS